MPAANDDGNAKVHDVNEMIMRAVITIMHCSLYVFVLAVLILRSVIGAERSFNLKLLCYGRYLCPQHRIKYYGYLFTIFFGIKYSLWGPETSQLRSNSIPMWANTFSSVSSRFCILRR